MQKGKSAMAALIGKQCIGWPPAAAGAAPAAVRRAGPAPAPLRGPARPARRADPRGGAPRPPSLPPAERTCGLSEPEGRRA